MVLFQCDSFTVVRSYVPRFDPLIRFLIPDHPEALPRLRSSNYFLLDTGYGTFIYGCVRRRCRRSPWHDISGGKRRYIKIGRSVEGNTTRRGRARREQLIHSRIGRYETRLYIHSREYISSVLSIFLDLVIRDKGCRSNFLFNFFSITFSFF